MSEARAPYDTNVPRIGKGALLMGVLNVTPDSFSDGGLFLDRDKAVERALMMEKEGADLIDIGGESSRPGADPVSLEEERKRVLPVLEKLAGKLSIPISVDTRRAVVARESLSLGARIINDITALRGDPDMGDVVRASNAVIVLMHMKGNPRTMQDNPHYKDVVDDVAAFLSERAAAAQEAGIDRKNIWVDPGIGFGKTVEHNLELIRSLKKIVCLGYPVVVGPSRKSFIGRITGGELKDRLEGTAAAVTAAVLHGANVVRVHDVAAMRRTVRMADALRGEQ
jgi:dihydropteroate synthase